MNIAKRTPWLALRFMAMFTSSSFLASAQLAVQPSAGPSLSPPAASVNGNNPATTIQAPLVNVSRPLHYVTGPVGVDQFIVDRVQQLFNFSPTQFSQGGITDPKSLELGLPVAIYGLPDYPEMHSGAVLDSAILTGYYYPLLQGNHEAISATVTTKAKAPFSNKDIIINVRRTKDDVNEQTVSIAIIYLATLAQLRSASYEVRIFTIKGATAATFKIIWLKADKNGTDLIYPVDQVRRPFNIEAGHIYTRENFFNIVNPPVAHVNIISPPSKTTPITHSTGL